MRTMHALLLASVLLLTLVSTGCDEDEVAPSACFETSLLAGTPLTFRLDASCSSLDGESGSGLEYRWDLDGDGAYDHPSGGGYTSDPVAVWRLPDVRAYTPVLQVRNAAGKTGESKQMLDPADLRYVVPDAGTPGVLYTWAGNGNPGFDGDGNPLLESRFSQPADLTFTSTGTYILDWNNHCVRRVENGTLRSVIGEPTFPGDGPGVHYPGEDDRVEPIPASHSLQNHPTQLIELPNQHLVLSAWHNHKVREYDPATESVWVTCGDKPGFEGDGQPHSSGVRFKQVEQVRYHDGDLYVLDQVNLRVRRIKNYMTDPDGIIETVVGRGEPPGFEGDGGPPTEAALNYELSDNPPMNGAIAFDDQGRLYVSDTLNHRIRRVDFDANVITTFAGNGQAGYSGDGGPATEASLNWPLDLEVYEGKLYFCDEYNHAVRVIDLETEIITTVAGRGERLVSNYDVAPSWEIGDGRTATEAYLYHPRGIAFDEEGRLYIADSFHYRIRRMVLPSGDSVQPFYPSDYRESFVEVADCRSSIDGHNPHTVRVHITPSAAQTYLDGLTLPVGTVIVKTETGGLPAACETDPVVRITAMRKGPAGTAPDSGNWIWQEFNFSPGEYARQGQLAECIACHSSPECPWDFTCVERTPE